jgi:hypothetical protein
VALQFDAELVRQFLKILGGGFKPTDKTTMSNSSSLTPSSAVAYRMVTFLVSGSSLTMEV